MSDYSEHLISMAGGDGEADVLGEIEARAKAATEGPWDQLDPKACDRPGLHIASDSAGILVGSANYSEDWEFIAHARTDIPTLLAMVREQRAVIERVKGLVRYLDRLAPGDKHYAGLISAALTTPEQS